jgi:hypothetical protein
MKVYQNCKIYGPYLRKDGRKHICAIFSDGSRKTVSYPKYLMEVYLNRYLEENETVDHIDRDFTNDDISNLRIVSKSQHTKDDVKRRKLLSGKCIWCNSFMEVVNNHHRMRGKAGPFCSRRCSGQYGASIQSGGKKLEKALHKKEYYYNIKKI